jgi:hypothetical protein
MIADRYLEIARENRVLLMKMLNHTPFEGGLFLKKIKH